MNDGNAIGRVIRRALTVVLAVMATLATTVVPTAGYGGFSDVIDDTYYADAVAWMTREDITGGTSPGCFSPAALTNRGQAVTFLWRYEGRPSAGSHPFRDIVESYQVDAVAWAYREGITGGVSADRFAPQAALSRGDAVTLLWRLAGSPTSGVGRHGFRDVNLGYQQAAVSWASSRGITEGTSSTTFDPHRAVSRAEFATFLWRYDGRPRVSPVNDVTCVPPSIGTGSQVALGLGSHNTGVVGGQNAGACSSNLSRQSGTVTIDDAWVRRNGSVLQNFDISGALIVEADNVTVRCGRVRGGSTYSIENRARGVRYEWIEAYQDSNGKVVLGGNYTITRCDISGGEDGLHINTGAVTVTECYIHDQHFIGAAHADGIQATSKGRVDRVDVVRSKIINFYQAPNAAFQINVASAWSIRDSYLWGGAFSILGDPGARGEIHNNYFGWDSSQFGAVGGVRSNRSGNVWWEWLSPRCSGRYSSSTCRTPSSHPGNGTPIG